jgi:multiple sugar transport system permease protein
MRAEEPSQQTDEDVSRRRFLIWLGIPAVVYVTAVALWPIMQGIYFSFFDYNLTRPAQRAFVGLGNYLDLWNDASSRRVVINTFVFTVCAVTAEMVLGFAVALALWADSTLNRICLALILIPVTVTPLAVGLIFRALLEPDFGLIGYWARVLELSSPRGLLGSEHTALATLVAIDVWQWTPLMALILLAGLKTIPVEVMEAADIDGARGLRRLRRVIIPMMGQAIMLALIMRTMDAFKIYDSVLAATGGGPNDATNVLMFQAAKVGLEFFDIGSASAISTFMLICIGVLAAIFITQMRRAERLQLRRAEADQ